MQSDSAFPTALREHVRDFENEWSLWRKTDTEIRPSVAQRLNLAADNLETSFPIDRDAFVARIVFVELFHRQSLNETPTVDEYTAQFPSFQHSIEKAFNELRSQSLDSTIVGPLGLNTEFPEVDGYTILSQLGSGSFGEVYKAEDNRLNRIVAIKILRHHRNNSVDRDQFLKEARNQSQIKHPGIVEIFDVRETEDGRPCIIAEYVNGESLSDRLAKTLKLSFHEAIRIVAEAAEHLHVAHQNGLIHRDIKPANLLLDDEGRVWIADFGLAIREADWNTGAEWAGTIRYMSPEQARREAHRLDLRSDIFSLGIVLVELLTGRIPYRSAEPTALAKEIARTPALPLRHLDDTLPRQLDDICNRALNLHPQLRYSTALDFADDLRTLIANDVHSSAAHTQVKRSPIPDPELSVVAPGDALSWFIHRLKERQVAVMVGPNASTAAGFRLRHFYCNACALSWGIETATATTWRNLRACTFQVRSCIFVIERPPCGNSTNSFLTLQEKAGANGVLGN